MKVCRFGSMLVVDLGERAIVEGIHAAEVIQLEGMRVVGDALEGVWAWVPVSELVAVTPS